MSKQLPRYSPVNHYIDYDVPRLVGVKEKQKETPFVIDKLVFAKFGKPEAGKHVRPVYGTVIPFFFCGSRHLFDSSLFSL